MHMFKPCLPPELFRPILQFTHPSDFDYTLCLVSRSFRVDVEAQFYKYVAVPERQLLYFCRTMIARPDLARRVQRLAFTGAVHREPEPGDTDVVAKMMKLLVNLRDLSISPSINHRREEGERPWPVHHDDVRILHGCPFKLERLACIFSWGEPLAQWLATQPQLVAFEHDGYPSDDDVRLDARDATLMRCSYLRISPYILACFHGREKKPQPVALRFDMRFNTVQQEFDAAQSLRDLCRNLKCLTLTRHTASEEYLSTSRILRTFADGAPNLTCLAIYENIDYSAGENKRILRTIKQHFAKLQVFVWAPLNYPVTQDEDGFTSSSSGFSIGSCSEEEEYSLDKTVRYAGAMFDAVPTLRMFISFRKGPCFAWQRVPASPRGGDAVEPRQFKRTWLSFCPDENTFRKVDPDHPMELFETNVPHGPPLAEPRVIHIYNVPISLPVCRSKNFQNL
ncbi:hypothetical protein F5148DRAFT_1182054 [Russula earlei]|uniref:Uncharacterized protein n=1 Tax=Russula earlei TaxID=71964 RepID=A0ACC0UEJ5_9AGAM|nr:hypothetical protein F5148DRAFT_1182054 [Russula earlei]